jgi:hypothetical protein
MVEHVKDCRDVKWLEAMVQGAVSEDMWVCYSDP